MRRARVIFFSCVNNIDYGMREYPDVAVAALYYAAESFSVESAVVSFESVTGPIADSTSYDNRQPQSLMVYVRAPRKRHTRRRRS